MFTSAMRALAAVCALGSLATAAPTAGTFTPFDMPTPLAGPCDLCEGPDGAEWVQDILVNKIARIDPNTGVVTEYDIPFTTEAADPSVLPIYGGRTPLACAIRPGKDGNIYAANGLRNQLVKVDLKTNKVSVFNPIPPNPLGNLVFLNDLYSNDEGIFVTQTTGNVISFFSFAEQKFTKNYEVPTPNSSPVAVFVASDGGVWTAEFIGNKIARLNATTGEFKEYPVPTPLTGPAVIRVQQDKYIWFTGFIGNSMGRVNMETGEVDTFVNPVPGSFPTEDTIDNWNRVWFSSPTQDTLNYIDAITLKFSTVEMPGTIVAAPVGLPFDIDIAINYGPGNAIWFTQAVENRVYRYQL